MKTIKMKKLVLLFVLNVCLLFGYISCHGGQVMEKRQRSSHTGPYWGYPSSYQYHPSSYQYHPSSYQYRPPGYYRGHYYNDPYSKCSYADGEDLMACEDGPKR